MAVWGSTAHRTPGFGAAAIDPWCGPGRGKLVRCVRLVVTLGLLVTASACASNQDAAADSAAGRLVFCLAPDQAPSMVNAAVAIGVAQSGTDGDEVDEVYADGQNLSIPNWHVRDSADFDRTCRALVAADQETTTSSTQSVDTGGIGDTVKSVLLLVAGAAVSLLSGTVRYGVDRRRLQAEQLGTAAGNFRGSYDDYRTRRQRGENPLDETFLTHRQELAARLREVLAIHPGWRRAKSASDTLTNELTVTALDDHARRPGSTAIGPVQTAAPTTQALDSLESDVTNTVRRLQHPVRSWVRRSWRR